jgi:hypothetical protein
MVWSVQTSHGCYHAAKVVIHAKVETEFQPLRKQNPRAFFTGRGHVTLAGTTAHIR